MKRSQRKYNAAARAARKASDIYSTIHPIFSQIMNELQPDPNLKPKLKTLAGARSADMNAINSLLNMVNNPNIVGTEVPRGVDPLADIRNMPPPAVAPAPDFIPPSPAPLPEPPSAVAPNKFFFTGRLRIGKDTTATAAGCKIFGFASPLYAIATHFFGREISSTVGKDLPGCRAFLQAIGQFGRGVLSDAYPMTPARALFEDAVRTKGVYGEFGKIGVDWIMFGRDPDIWLKACLQQVDEYLAENPDARVAITNVRFDNELKMLRDSGWSGYHVMASQKTWSERLLKSKLTPESPAVKDISEKLAAVFDADVIKQISAQKLGPRLRVIWSDSTPPPSPRIHTTESFLKSIGAPAPATQTISNDDF